MLRTPCTPTSSPKPPACTSPSWLATPPRAAAVTASSASAGRWSPARDAPLAGADRRQGDARAGPSGARRPARAARPRRPDDGHSGGRGARRVAGQRLVPPAHAGQVRLRRGGARRHAAGSVRGDESPWRTRGATTTRTRPRTPQPRGWRGSSTSESPSAGRSGRRLAAVVPQGVARRLDRLQLGDLPHRRRAGRRRRGDPRHHRPLRRAGHRPVEAAGRRPAGGPRRHRPPDRADPGWATDAVGRRGRPGAGRARRGRRPRPGRRAGAGQHRALPRRGPAARAAVRRARRPRAHHRRRR